MRISDWSSDVCSSDLDRSDFTAWQEQRRVIRVRGKHAREPFIRHVNQYSHAPAACMKAAKRFHQAFPKAGVSWPGITDGPMFEAENGQREGRGPLPAGNLRVRGPDARCAPARRDPRRGAPPPAERSEENTFELQSLISISSDH